MNAIEVIREKFTYIGEIVGWARMRPVVHGIR